MGSLGHRENLASHILKRLFPPRSTARRSHRLPLPSIGTGIFYAGMDLNPFRLCSGLKFLGYFMILLVLGLIAISYHAVIVLTWGPHLLDGGFKSFLSFLIVALFHVLVIVVSLRFFLALITNCLLHLNSGIKCFTSL